MEGATSRLHLAGVAWSSWWLRLTFLAVAGAGLVALLATEGRGGVQQLWGLTDTWETRLDLDAARAILFGPSLHDWYVHGGANGHPPLSELLVVPLAPLPDPVAAVAGRCIAAVALFLGLWLWQEGEAGVRAAIWPALASLPAVHAVVIDHWLSALGLASLSAALWAQRHGRWYLAGAAAAIGAYRLGNALPVIAMLVVGCWGSPRLGLRALASGTLVLATMVALTTWVDPSWVSDYWRSLPGYPLAGWPRFADAVGGTIGVAALQVAVAGIAVWLVRKQAGRSLDPDRSALGLALSIVSASGQGPYSGIFALPALVRVGGRPGVEALPWIASATAWIALVVASLVLAGPEWQVAWSLFTLVATWFLIHSYPLLRAGSEPYARAA